MGIKHSNVWYIIWIAMMTVSIIPSRGRAQSMGNPVVLQHKMWSIGLAAEYAEYIMDGHKYHSVRGLTKVDFSVFQNFNIAFLLGMGTLHIYYPEELKLSHFLGSNSFALGVSAKVVRNVPAVPLLKIFGEAGGLRLSPAGDVSSTSAANPGDFHIRFHWYEYWGSAGTIYTHHPYDVYIGYQGRVNRQIESVSQEKFVSAVQSNVIFGLDFHLPQRFQLNMQVRIGNGSAVSFGISQRGFLIQ